MTPELLTSLDPDWNLSKHQRSGKRTRGRKRILRQVAISDSAARILREVRRAGGAPEWALRGMTGDSEAYQAAKQELLSRELIVVSTQETACGRSPCVGLTPAGSRVAHQLPTPLVAPSDLPTPISA